MSKSNSKSVLTSAFKAAGTLLATVTGDVPERGAMAGEGLGRRIQLALDKFTNKTQQP